MLPNNPTISTLHDLLDYDASQFNAAEVQLKNILGQWIGEAGQLQLKNVLQKYLDFVELHLLRMDEFLREERVGFLRLNNPVMKTMIEETEDRIGRCTNPEVKDACLLACIQTINHFKISMYGTAAAYAGVLGMTRFESFFHEAEINEKHIDDRLSQLAGFEINRKASTPIVLPGL